jgi:hypothetical protein
MPNSVPELQRFSLLLSESTTLAKLKYHLTENDQMNNTHLHNQQNYRLKQFDTLEVDTDAFSNLSISGLATIRPDPFRTIMRWRTFRWSENEARPVHMDVRRNHFL